MLTPTIIIVASVVILAIFILIALSYRVVVPTNSVDIVQSSKKTVSYGKDQEAGNTYYKWPSWVPSIGVKTISLPVSVFDIELNGYAGYDKGRVPFVIDIIAFFRITDSNIAAQRISSFEELRTQLQSILQGAIRTILASNDIEHILEGRSEFGERFTKEVDHQLVNWGVQSVKCIELMDIRDASDSHVISNIMQKKKSLIEMESRTEVAANMKSAQIAEIQAEREVQLNKQEAEQQVGIREATKQQQIGVAREQASQVVKEQSRLTAEKDMEIARVQQVRQAEIEKDSKVVLSQQNSQQAIIAAEAEKQKLILLADAEKAQAERRADGELAKALKAAEGAQAQGLARAEAEKAFQLASVTAQTELAKEIGQNGGYQTYLIQIRQVEANEKVGVEQAKALQAANIKVIANSGDAGTGIASIGDILSAKGGTKIGAMLEAVAQTDTGKKLLGVEDAPAPTKEGK